MNDVISDIRFVYAVVHNRRERLSLGGNGLFGKKDLPAAKSDENFPSVLISEDEFTDGKNANLPRTKSKPRL